MDIIENRDLRVYVRPEVEEIKLKSEGIICTSNETGDNGGDI
jgi:hypothetical protein